MTGKKSSERNLNRGKVSWIFKILLVIFSAAVIYTGCSKQVSVNDNNTININFVYVTDNSFTHIEHDQIQVWMEKSKYYFKQSLGVDVEFKDKGVIHIDDFFNKHFDPSKKQSELELVRISPTASVFERHKENILSIMKNQDLNALDRVILPYIHKQAKTYEELFSFIEDQYFLSLGQARRMGLLREASYKYRSGINWVYVLNNAKEYDIVITNGPVIEDYLNPYAFYRLAAGAFSFGFSERGRYAFVTTFPYVSEKGSSQAFLNEVMPLAISHELGHAIFYLSDTIEDTGSVMSHMPTASVTSLRSQSINLTKEEKDQARAALYLRRGNKYFENRLYEKAIGAYQQALNYAPNLGPAYYALSAAYIQDKKYSEARQILTRAIQVLPSDYHSYELLGNLFLSQPYKTTDWLANSIKAYEKAIEINPFLMNARINLAYNYQSIGETDKAILEYQTVLQLDSTNVDVLRQLGLIYSQRGDCGNMYVVYDRLLKIEPNFAEAYYRLGLCQRKINPDKAAEYFRKYLDLEPDGEYAEIVKGYISNRES